MADLTPARFDGVHSGLFNFTPAMRTFAPYCYLHMQESRLCDYPMRQLHLSAQPYRQALLLV